MLKSLIIGLIDLCVRRPWWTIALALCLAAGASAYAARHFAIHTDINDLISPDLPWAKRAAHYVREFPQRDILVVLDAPTPELADQAVVKLANVLTADASRFRTVSHPGSGGFFEQNGLLFLPTDDVKRVTAGLVRANALVGTLAADPSLRGALDALRLVLIGLEHQHVAFDDIVSPLRMAADTVEATLAGRPASFSWRVLASGKPPAESDLRRFLQIDPVLDFRALQPGRAATDAITAIATDLKLDREYQARVRQTGRIPIDDDEFGTIKENAVLNATLSLIAVVIILWLALYSLRIIFAVVVCLLVGLAVSTAVGLLLVGALNLMSDWASTSGFSSPCATGPSAMTSRSCARRCAAPPRRSAQRWRLPPWRSRSASPRSCRPPIAGSPSSGKSPAPE
jgi:hypothetical protein